MDTLMAQQVAQRFAPLGYALHEVMPLARSRAKKAMKKMELDRDVYPSQFIHSLIGCTHKLLHSADTGRWVIEKDARRKQLHASLDMWHVRVLARTTDGLVPTSGPNFARRAFYDNRIIVDQTPESALIDDHGFLVVWNFVDDSLDLELIHTFKPWARGRAEQIDLRMPLVADELGLQSLRYDPAPDDSLDGLGLVDPHARFQKGTVVGHPTA